MWGCRLVAAEPGSTVEAEYCNACEAEKGVVFEVDAHPIDLSTADPTDYRYSHVTNGTCALCGGRHFVHIENSQLWERISGGTEHKDWDEMEAVEAKFNVDDLVSEYMQYGGGIFSGEEEEEDDEEEEKSFITPSNSMRKDWEDEEY